MNSPERMSDEDWKQFICRACGLIYDERLGDPDSGLQPGTRFEDIPDDWACPLCGVTKADFERYTARAPVFVPRPAAPARSRDAGIVIVGAGLAGWSVARAIRALNGDVPVTLVTGCTGDVYSKPELSVALTRGVTPDDLRHETGEAAAHRLGIRLLAETFAVGLSSSRRTLRTTRGSLRFTSLVLAQGARPAAIAGLPAELCWRINDLSTWTGLHRALAAGPQSVAIVGAGMVGCELAEDLARAGHAVTLIARTTQPLEPLLPEAAGRRLATNLACLGVRFLGGTAIAGVTRRDRMTLQVHTDTGGVVLAEQVISAVGLVTEARLARSAGLSFDRGIVVDPVTLCSTAPGIYAIGDCISIDGLPCRFIEPIARQADVIAHGVLGLPHPGYQHTAPVIRLKTRSTPLVLHGLPSPAGTWRMVEETPERLRMEQWEDGALRARLAA